MKDSLPTVLTLQYLRKTGEKRSCRKFRQNGTYLVRASCFIPISRAVMYLHTMRVVDHRRAKTRGLNRQSTDRKKRQHTLRQSINVERSRSHPHSRSHIFGPLFAWVLQQWEGSVMTAWMQKLTKNSSRFCKTRGSWGGQGG